MATYYVDIDGGNDSNDGLSFANRKKTLDSASDAVSAGDTVRMMGHPATSLGNGTVKTTSVGTWIQTSGYKYYRTVPDGDITLSTTQGETNVALANHGMTTGDSVRIVMNTDIHGVYTITRVDDDNFKLDEFQAGSTSFSDTTDPWIWNISGEVITLASACTQNIACTGTNGDSTNNPSDGTIRGLWTASSDVTVTRRTTTSSNDYRYNTTYTRGQYWEGGWSDEIDVSASFGTGKAAYWATGTLDLSGYQQISFNYSMPESGALGSNGDLPNQPYNFSLRLCTDTTGDTSVHTINFGVTKTATDTFVWYPILYDFGTNLNSAIKSIALYIDSDEGRQMFRFSNIIACKAASSADSVNFRSIIGLNTANDPFWYRPLSINGTKIVLNRCGQGDSWQRYYQPTPTTDELNAGCHWSSSGTHTIYKRDTIATGVRNYGNRATSVPEGFWGSQVDGNSSNFITISGGWDRTDMSTQNGKTILHGTTGYGRGFSMENSNYICMENVGALRYYDGMYIRNNEYIKAKNWLAMENYNGLYFTNNDHYYDWTFVGVNNRRNIYSYLNYNGTDNYVDEATTPRSIYLNGCGRSYSLQQRTWAGDTIWDNLEIYNCPYRCTSALYDDPSSHSTVRMHKPIVFGDIFGQVSTRFSHFADMDNNPNVSITMHNCTQRIVFVDWPNAGLSGPVGITTFMETTDARYSYTSGPPRIAGSLNSGGTAAGSAVYNSMVQDLIIYDGALCKAVSSDTAPVYLQNINMDNMYANWALVYSPNAGVLSKNHGDVSGVYKSFLPHRDSSGTGGGTIDSETTIRHTASGLAWRFKSNSYQIDEDDPVKVSLGKLAVASSGEVTIGIWIYRETTNAYAKLIALKNADLGVSSDVSVTSSGSATTWVQQTLAFTPTAQGFIDIELQLYNSSGYDYVYFDDFSATQA